MGWVGGGRRCVVSLTLESIIKGYWNEAHPEWDPPSWNRYPGSGIFHPSNSPLSTSLTSKVLYVGTEL